MGAWGAGIFQDDTACDIRDEYRDHLGNGLTGPEATERILKNYASSFSDPDDSGVACFALAATQWKLGRLEPETLERTLQLLDSGSDLKRWEGNPKDYGARKSALDKLRAQITSPRPAAKKVKKLVLCEWHLGFGELFAVKLLSGKLVVFRVIGIHTDKGGTYPDCELLDWIGDEIPDQSILARADVKGSLAKYGTTTTKLMIVGIRKKAASRILALGIRLEPAQKDIPPVTVLHWKEIGKFLSERFQFE